MTLNNFLNHLKTIIIPFFIIFGLTFFCTYSYSNPRLDQLFKKTLNPIEKNCKIKFKQVFSQIAKKNQYRILDHSLGKSGLLQLFILLIYNDQPTHLSMSINTQSCQINTQESFGITVPCPEIRESLFKRFNIIGRLSQTTMVLRLDSPKKKEHLIQPEQARPIVFLTQNLNGKGCFVTKKQNNVTPKKKFIK